MRYATRRRLEAAGILAFVWLLFFGLFVQPGEAPPWPWLARPWVAALCAAAVTGVLASAIAWADKRDRERNARASRRIGRWE